MQKELLLEIGSEEIPAGFIGPALKSMQNTMAEKLDELELQYDSIRTAATPRRLAVCVEGLVSRQPDREEEFIGPAKKAAYDQDNKPTKAAVGFALSKGAAVEDLQVVNTSKGEYVILVRKRIGEKTKNLLPELLSDLTVGVPFAKSMRWGDGNISFARPIHWLLALYEGEVIDFQVGDIKSGNTTRGHRFMAPGPLKVIDFTEYVDLLRQNYVLVDIAERRQAVVTEIRKAASERSGVKGAKILEDEELIDTVCNLVEYPHGVCGKFETRFLELPDDVLITSMREHQKYFCVTDTDGRLIANFVAVNNTRVPDQDLATEGHQRVLRARLEDAFFFFNDDRRKRLEHRVEDLSGLIFQAKLGTMLEKTERIAELARILAQKLAPEYTAKAERAATLAKADLLTAMVNEFPSLQGVIGRDYASLDEESPEVATAILEHYLPVRAGGNLPTEISGALVGMADRIDTVAGCFGIGQVPTGTTDPFGLRRLVLGLLHIMESQDFTLSLAEIVESSLQLYGEKLTEDRESAKRRILEFIKGRFVNDLIAKGVPGSAVEAVTSVAFDDVVDCRAKIEALAAIRQQQSFTVLAAAFKRVMNIIKGHTPEEVKVELLQEGAERNLYEAFAKVKAEIGSFLEEKEYGRALEIILRMKEPVDVFFDEVMVMTEEESLKQNRLNLLSEISGLFLQIGDISKMQSTSQ
ncbi:MAG: glycine--tRNA ligase subunit beta [Deltaproteobacteria bacterium]|jgi:glycyl-tRNA synthetase beta chain|nr:glycine--tRNA ligase subunit beta [Deltaproteobacteria bacterium]